MIRHDSTANIRLRRNREHHKSKPTSVSGGLQSRWKSQRIRHSNGIVVHAIAQKVVCSCRLRCAWFDNSKKRECQQRIKFNQVWGVDRMLNLIRWPAVVLLVLAMFVTLMPSAPAATPKDIIVIGTTDKVPELSPESTCGYWTGHIVGQTAEALLTTKPGTTEPSPGLATSWAVSADGKVYTFKLRQEVTFSDGTPFDADAVKFTIERALRLKGQGSVYLFKIIQQVESVDSFTVKFTLEQPDATFLSRISDLHCAALILSPKSTPANEFTKARYAGTGPYRLVSYIQDQQVIYEANSTYRGEKPKTKRVIERFFVDASTLTAAVTAGEVDIGFRTFNPDDIRSLSSNTNLQVIKGPALSVRCLVFNVTNPPFDNPAIRRAISFAVDRGRISSNVFSGINPPLYSMVPAGLWSYKKSFPERDLARAQSLLTQAGYNAGKKLDLTVWYTPTRYGNTEPDAAAVLKSALEDTRAFNVNLKSQEWSSYVSSFRKGEFPVFLLGWNPDYVDPDNFLAPFVADSPQTLGTLLNAAPNPEDKETYEQFKKTLAAARATANHAQRVKLYEQVQDLMAKSVVVLPLWQNNLSSVAVARKNIKGIVLDASMLLRNWLIYKD